MKIKKSIITNTDWFDEYGENYVIKKIEIESLISTIARCSKYKNDEIVVINSAPRLLINYCIAKTVLLSSKISLISVDLILSKPNSLFENIKNMILSILFRNVNCFILYMMDWSGYKKYYKIKDQQLKYIPFKVNSYEELKAIEVVDDGYIFSGGMSKRDYNTLFRSVEGQDVNLVVMVPPVEVCRNHGTFMPESIPSNVKIIHDDFGVNSWNECMSKSKFVVIQISKDTISPTGISTYLVAMALKKCVIITEGPATNNIIPHDCAVIVKPDNVSELRKAILRVSSDDVYRKYISKNGYEYAMSLKGHSRLVSDIVNFIDSRI